MEWSLNETSLKMIEELSNAKAPSGFEEESIAVARKYADESLTIEEDCLRNLFLLRPDDAEQNGPVFMLDAHSDEVGFMIHSIRPNGMLRFIMLGGYPLNSLPSSRVWVRNAKGKWIPGIIASKPLHFMTAAEKANQTITEVSQLSIDIGATSYEEARDVFHIRIGEPAISDVGFTYDEEHDVMIGKGLDCRIGCAALIETMNRLKDEKLNVCLRGVLSSQEEIGERGVKVAINRAQPQISIVFEGTPADDTFTEPYAIQTAVKKGPMLRHIDRSLICSPRFQRYALDLAEELDIPAQSSVREGGGNNGADIQIYGNGVPVIVLGVPVRYVHSHYGIASYVDFEATVQLACAIIRRMNAEILGGF